MDRDSGFISRTHTRYRVNLHRTMGRLGAVLRRIKTKVPSLKTLGAPEWLLTRWGAREHGLILVTGPTGSGKSTTIASLLQWMNENLVRHIQSSISSPATVLISLKDMSVVTPAVSRPD